MKNIQDSYILLVDDNPNNLQLLGEVLSEEGYQIGLVENGEQALIAAKESPPDLVLLDVMMPVMDGFETCKHFKAVDDLKEIPIIFLTARSETEKVLEGLELGAVDYLCKPFNVRELLMRVGTQLEMKAKEDTIQKISQERMELIHILCHDLVNPMGIAESIAINIEPNNIKDYKAILLRVLRNGLKVIDLVHQMQYLERHDITLETVNLFTALLFSSSLVKDKLKSKNIQLIHDMPEEILVYAEETSLVNSVLNNLLTNAIKFSYPDSEIIATCQLLEGKTILSIRDFGIGMSKSVLKQVFQVGKGGSREGTVGESGTGFGMPLVERFIKAYGGDLEIISKDVENHPNDHGTEIRLTFNSRTEE